jgi:hypothetical protein
MSVIKFPLLFDLQEKVDELVLSIYSCPLIIISENALNKCIKMVIVTSTTGKLFLLSICMHFLVWEILRRWSACAPIAYEVVRDCRKFEKS